MFFFRHPKPVVDRRPVAEHSVQIELRQLPALTALHETARPSRPTVVPSGVTDEQESKDDGDGRGEPTAS
ncbi:hypothetical protein CDL60_00635 [Roseateles noduli]|nr:hypothetical protein CDL60_00635 [Roseateles noduli]